MTTSYYSVILDHDAGRVWEVIRDFNGLATWFSRAVSSSEIEDGRTGDSIGAVRRFRMGDAEIREKLLAMSDIECSYSYEFAEPKPFPVDGYVATLKVSPVGETGQSFVEWWTEFDAEPAEREHWERFFADEVFAPALKALADHLS